MSGSPTTLICLPGKALGWKVLLENPIKIIHLVEERGKPKSSGRTRHLGEGTVVLRRRQAEGLLQGTHWPRPFRDQLGHRK